MAYLYQILPFVAVVAFAFATIGVSIRPSVHWVIPATVSLLFLGWSLHSVTAEGLGGVWVEHTRNAWGNQIWFDLLIAVAIAWSLILPRARAVRMRTWPWLILIAMTGCIGLAAMFARCRYLETRTI